MPEIVPVAQGPKTLTVKLTADRHLKFFNIARDLEVSPTDLAQVVMDLFMEDCEKDEAERKWTAVAERL